MKKQLLSLILVSFGAIHFSYDQLNSASPISERMKWFSDAKFGLFVHWGLYAIPAGYWHGKAIPGPSEWIMYNGKIPVKDYEPLAKQFNPTEFSGEKWAALARETGMKYDLCNTLKLK